MSWISDGFDAVGSIFTPTAGSNKKTQDRAQDVATTSAEAASAAVAESVGADSNWEAGGRGMGGQTNRAPAQQGSAPQSFVMPTYGGWSNLDPGARGPGLQQTGQMTFDGPATDAARGALDNSLGGAARPAAGNTVGGPAGDSFVDAGPVPQGMGQRFTQQPGMQLSQQQRGPLVDPTLWRMSQGKI